MRRGSNDDFGRIGSRAKDASNFWHGFNAIENSDGESFVKEDDERMSACDIFGVFNGLHWYFKRLVIEICLF